MELVLTVMPSTIKWLYSFVSVVFNLPGLGPLPLLIEPDAMSVFVDKKESLLGRAGEGNV